ncbi:helix-turn-helix domain-containing protein [Salinisphaera sp. P385]|uniref:Helix-turn-helix domain-containing protein n=1 Tax=Spectribacter acetivorans TaxID=3075603 RepID=A0ABU3B9R4_9GAMM|nr:helix-turn-helix domain-containing protein [Salinisphaera sp. P385]MDT0619211.1 helix-turn-helix domain-containing protein [Salinisphaera sp. P385]
MAITDICKQHCSVAQAVHAVGDTWSLMVLRELFLGSRRFDDLQRFTGASPHLLSKRLRALGAEGIVERRPYQQHPVRHEYRLTDKGLDLWPVIAALRSWGDRWAAQAAEPPVTVRHRGCGAQVEPVPVCPDCGEPIGARDLALELSPQARAQRQAMR